MIAVEAASFGLGLAYGAAVGACLAVAAVVLMSCVLTEAAEATEGRGPRRLSGNAPTIPATRVARKATAETMGTIPGLGAPASDGIPLAPRLHAAKERQTGEHQVVTV